MSMTVLSSRRSNIRFASSIATELTETARLAMPVSVRTLLATENER